MNNNKEKVYKSKYQLIVNKNRKFRWKENKKNFMLLKIIKAEIILKVSTSP